MGPIIIICALIITFLLSLVIFLSVKLYRFKKQQQHYEMFERSQLIAYTAKYTPKIQVSNTVTPIAQQTDAKLKSDYELTANYMKSEGKEDSSNVSKEFARKNLVSAQNLNDIKSSLSRFEADSSSNTNGLDDIEISMLEMSNNEVPAIHFKLVYISQNSTLKLHIARVSNLPLQFRKNCSSYVKISLITNSEKLSSYNTNVKKSLNPEYDENCTFSPYRFEQLNSLTVRIFVYAKRKQISKRQLIGDLWIPLSRPDLEPDVELVFNEKLSLACPRTGKRGPLIMIGKLGYLFVQLEYQPEAERLKVIVRKGQNLFNKSTNNFQITKPEYYVIINLLRDNVAVVYKETKPASGVSPIWNQPFIFDVPSFQTNKYWIQILVMQGRHYTRDGTIGQVLIGPNTTISGIQHWNDITKPDFLEVAKWHPIANIGTHCF